MQKTAWPSLFLLIIVLASGIAYSNIFFDESILPKQLLAYFIAGVSIIVIFISSYFSKVSTTIVFDRALLLFLLLLSLTFGMHNDIESLLNLIFFIVVYVLCCQACDKTTMDYAFFIGVIVCSCYSMIISLWQFYQGYNIDGGYDTITGFSLILALLYVFILNNLANHRVSPSRIFAFFAIAIFIFILLSMRTALIAACCTSLFVLRHKLRLLIVIAGTIAIIALSVYKSDSTCGRLAIYKISLSLFDNPKNIILGRGATGFRSSYMQRQAKLLKKESDAQRNLADNIKHPLNEYLLFGINYGVLLLLVGTTLFIIYILKSKLDFLSISLFTTIIIFSTFTYPFHYPITYIMLAFAFARVSKAIHQNHFRYTKALARLLPILYVSLGAVLTVTSFKLYIWNRDWKKAYTDGVYGATERSQQEYRRLAESPLAYDEFYYNWAYMLMRNHKTKDAVRVINKSKIIDYDTQMLKGELSASLGDIKHALQYYNQASEMCPSKFMPLFAQFNLYEQLGMHDKKLDIGHKILCKKEKIPSTTTRNIKEKVFYSIYK